MLLLAPPFFALCWVCFVQRRFVALRATRIRGKLLALAAFLVEVGVAHLTSPGLVATLCIGGAGVLLLFCLYLNRYLPGIPLITLGVILNLAAMLCNGGFMPMGVATAVAVGYHPYAVALGQHLPGSKDVLLQPGAQRLGFLGDRFVPPPSLGVLSKMAYSVGDIVFSIGLGVLIMRIGRCSREGQRGCQSRT